VRRKAPRTAGRAIKHFGSKTNVPEGAPIQTILASTGRRDRAEGASKCLCLINVIAV
jgi:hypothetical protein